MRLLGVRIPTVESLIGPINHGCTGETPSFRWASGVELSKAAPLGMVGMALRYVLRFPVSAILDKPDGEQVSVNIPAGVVLRESPALSATLLGSVGVYWEGRHYSVALNDLLKKADRVETARALQLQHFAERK